MLPCYYGISMRLSFLTSSNSQAVESNSVEGCKPAIVMLIELPYSIKAMKPDEIDRLNRSAIALRLRSLLEEPVIEAK